MGKKLFNRIALVFIGLTIGIFSAIQVDPVQKILLNNSLIDKVYRKYSSSKYNTLKESIYNNFPGFAYAYITQNVVGSEKDKEKIVQKLVTFVHENVFVPQGKYKVIDAAPIEQLKRGVGWCDQVSNLFIRLAAFRDIPARMVFLKDTKGVSPHTVADVYLNNAWRIVDPLYNIPVLNNNKTIATSEEICKGDILTTQSLFDEMKLTSYKPLFCNTPQIFLKNSATSPVIFNAVKNNEDLFALPEFIGTNLYIDLSILSIKDNYTKKDDYLYASARMLQILGKYEKSINLYNKIIEEHPNSTHLDESYYFSGLAKYHNKQYLKSLDTFKILLEKHPSSAWLGYTRLFAAKSLMALGEIDDAKIYLKKVEGEASRESKKILYFANKIKEQ